LDYSAITLDRSASIFAAMQTVTITCKCISRARGGAEPAAGRFSFLNLVGGAAGVVGGRGAEHSELRGRVDDRLLAPAGRWVSDVCSLQDSRLARSSLSVGGAAPRAAGFLFADWPWPPSYGVDVAAGRSHRQGDGVATCALDFCKLGIPAISFGFAARSGLSI
jgi:hypothetical protein